jgi:spoIIIJ-associated protein
MAKGKDFYGKEISEVIEQACRDLGASREDLDIEVLETGSAGIFGLCKKKAHIRVQRKTDALVESTTELGLISSDPAEEVIVETVVSVVPIEPVLALAVVEEVDGNQAVAPPAASKASRGKRREKNEPVLEEQEAEPEDFEEEVPLEPPSEESLALIQEDLHKLLSLMGLSSEVHVIFEQNTVLCNISGPHETHIVGPEGRTLDSLQYLLRKMVSRLLPDKIMLALNAGDFRERRAEELKIRAVELAALVKEDGKTQAIAALNPSERRVVHMALQDDKGVRSRSVGEGLFKKVLIYKPGKGRRPVSKKRRGGSGGRPSGG